MFYHSFMVCWRLKDSSRVGFGELWGLYCQIYLHGCRIERCLMSIMLMVCLVRFVFVKVSRS